MEKFGDNELVKQNNVRVFVVYNVSCHVFVLSIQTRVNSAWPSLRG